MRLLLALICLLGCAAPVAAQGTYLFQEDFETLNPVGASCTDCLHFTSKWTTAPTNCTFENVSYSGDCPVNPAWSYALQENGGDQGTGDASLRITHARAMDQVNIGYQVDLPNTPDIETAGEVYWRIKYKAITADAFAVWDNDTGAGQNKWIDFGNAGVSRVITTVMNPIDNYNAALSGPCTGIAAWCDPADWGIGGVGTNWHHASINNKYGGIAVQWGIDSEGMAGPALVGVDGLTGIPSGGWVCLQMYAKTGTSSTYEFKIWRSAIGVDHVLGSPLSSTTGGASGSLASNNWNGTWYLGGYVGEPIVDYSYEIDDFEVSTDFDADYCSQEGEGTPAATPRRLRFRVADAGLWLGLAAAGLVVGRRRRG